ncbi:MAG: DUF779 domain-containing protein [Azovibrio sp.]|uniref:DUF779 domain-containing protein n=1 Tax=Azovibrio sp. TaxID=1872673 RepID=UPI003C75345B
MPERILATPAALALVEQLKARHGPLLFYQSGGCCEGSAPLCLRAGELQIGPNDILLGHIAGVPFYTSATEFNLLRSSELTLDVVRGRGDSFSLEAAEGDCFIVHSRRFSDAELLALEQAG